MAFTFKLLGTSLLWIGSAILARMHLAPNAKDWLATLHEWPLWILVSLLLLLPIGWLCVEFIATCFIEVRARMLEHTAPVFALGLVELPRAAIAVLGVWWDSCSANLGRWRFDGRYRKRIAEECQHLHTQTGLLHATAGFSLEEAYTELNMASSQYGDINTSLLASTIKGRESIYSFLRTQPPGTALALLGRPGGGKTTLLRHLGLLYSHSKQGKRRLRSRIPIIIELRRVTELFTDKTGVRWTYPSLIQVIQYYWKQHSALGELMKKAPAEWLKRHLASGRVLVMVDGLDEVPHRVGSLISNRQTPRERVSQWLETEMQREGQRDCLFLITSRPGGFAEAPLKQRVTVVEVQPLTLEQSERFIYAFQFGCQRRAHPVAKECQLDLAACKATEKLQQELRNKPHLYDLRVNPLLLHMVCLLHHLRGRLPSDRSDLYKETCDVLLNRDLRAPGISELLRPEDKLAALRPLAAYFMRSESPAAKSTQELLPVIETVFETLNFAAKDFFDYVAKDSGLLQEVEKGLWDFPHKTFYEYLNAEYWEKQPPGKKELLTWVEQDWWRVTLLFYSARSEDSPVVAAALHSRTPKAWSLAFECINAGHRINTALREKAKISLNESLADPVNDQTFIPAARALLDLRMREIVPIDKEGKWFWRKTFVSQAEYHLFLLSRPADERWMYVPPHRGVEHFSGDPNSPVLGVTPRQAIAFSRWAADVAEQEWRLLPSHPENVELPDGCWCGCQIDEDDDFVLGGHIVDSNEQIGKRILRWAQENNIGDVSSFHLKEVLHPYSSKHLNGGRINLRLILRSLVGRRKFSLLENRLLQLYHRTKYTQPGNARFGYLIQQQMSMACSMAILDHPLDFSNTRTSEDLDRYLISKVRMDLFVNLATALNNAVNFDIASLVVQRIVEADDRSTNRIWWRMPLEVIKQIFNTMMLYLFENGSNGPYSSNFEQSIREVLKDYRPEILLQTDVAGRRLRLLFSISIVLDTAENPIAHRTAWLEYGICLIEILELEDGRNWRLDMFYCILRLLEARKRGNIECWEGILLVKKI